MKREPRRRLTGEQLLQRTDIWVEQAVYSVPTLTKYRDNPLIHSLVQPQPWDVAYKLWRQRPPIDPAGRSYPSHQRLLLLLDALRFFEPLEMHERLDFVLNGLLFDGYVPRNPLPVRRHTAREQLVLIGAGQEGDIRYTPELRVIAALLIAFPGMGKSASIRNKFKQQPALVIHNTFIDTQRQVHKFDAVQIPSMMISCPEDGSTKRLCLAFFEELDFLLGSDFYSIYTRKGYTKEILMDLMADAVRDHHIGLLAFDELQRLNRAASGGEAETLDFFVRLMDKLSVPIVFIGTPSTERILARLPHKIRRTDVLGDCRWTRLHNDQNWENLLAALWPYQYLKAEVKRTAAYSQMLYDQSQGIIDYAVKIYILAQIYAIITETEHLFSPQTIALAAKENLYFARELLDALASGDPATLTKLDLDDLQPLDMQQAIEQATIRHRSSQGDIVPDEAIQTPSLDSTAGPSETSSTAETAEDTATPPQAGSRQRRARTSPPIPNTIEGIVAAGRAEGKAAAEVLEENGLVRSGTEFL